MKQNWRIRSINSLYHTHLQPVTYGTYRTYIQVHTYKLLVTVSCSDPLSLSSLFNSSFLSSLFLLPHPLGERDNSSAFLSSFSSSFFFLFYSLSHLSSPFPLPPPPRQFPFSESSETGPTGKSRDFGRLNSRPLFLCPTEPVLESSFSLRPRPSTFVSSNAEPTPLKSLPPPSFPDS